jgi:hypothetical protein
MSCLIQICTVCGMGISCLSTDTGKREFCHNCLKCDKQGEDSIKVGKHQSCREVYHGKGSGAVYGLFAPDRVCGQ